MYLSSIKLFAAAALMVSSCSVAMAQQEPTLVTITVDKNNGTLTRDGAAGTWCNAWTSNATNPGAKVTCTKNDMQWSGNYIDARSGQGLTETFKVRSNTKGYYVSAYSFNFKLVGTGAQTLSEGDNRTVSVTSTNQRWEVTNTDTSLSPEFTIAGANDGTLLTDFTITLSPIPGYVEEPETLKTTTIINGAFDPQTNWYTLQLAGLYMTYTPGTTYMTLNSITTEFSDADLWCFTGDDTDGYQIYNKAAGPSMMFAAPITMTGTTGSTSYAIVTTPGRTNYCYDWQLRETEILGEGIPAFFINEKGYTNKTLNNRNGIVAFWTGGTDAGSAIQIRWAQQTLDITPANGSFLRDGDKSDSEWCSVWESSLNNDFTFATVHNNLSHSGDNLIISSGAISDPWTFGTPDNVYVTEYEFDFARHGYWGSTTMNINLPKDQTVVVTTDGGHAAVSGLTKEDNPAFALAATPTNANKQLILSNFSATFRRAEKENQGIIVFRYDGTPAYNVCYRIPTITTIENGPNKGRILALNDYRYSGQDIGNGRIDLYMSYSEDNGKTWSTPDHMRDAEGNPVAQGTGLGTVATSLQNPDCGFGDAAMVSDRESGKVLAVSVCGRTPFWSGRRNNPNQVARWYSEDGGTTWTKFTNITEKIYSLFDGTTPYGYIDSQFIGSGRMIQSRYIKEGDYYRVYAVMSGYNNAVNNVSNWVLYTDDFGETWHILGDPMTPAVTVAGDEPKAEELPDGSVLLAARCNLGNRNFNIFRYTDISKAEGYWGTSVNTNMGMGSINACNGEIMILPVANVETGEKCYMAFQSFPYGGARNNVSIAWKTLSTPEDIYAPESFKKWNGRFQVSSTGSAYSTMCFQHDNTIGFLYEEATLGKSFCGVYRNLKVEDITDGKYEYCADDNAALRSRMTSDFMAYRIDKEIANEEAGEYVGQWDGRGNPEADRLAAEFEVTPSAESYIAFNNAMLEENPERNYIEMKECGIYTLLNAHNGSYEFGDRWLTTDGSVLTATEEAGEEDCFLFLHRNDDSEGWLIYHPATKSFVGQTPAEATAYAVAAHHSGSHEYLLQSTTEGHTTLVDTDPAVEAAPAIFLGYTANGPTIAAAAASEQASKWYLAFVRMADDSEMPDLVSTALGNIGVNEAADIRYYDVYGREVKHPRAGQLLITSAHRKVVFAE